MKNDPDIHKKAKGFDVNPQNINKKGRPLKIYTILKEKGYSKDDITTAFGELAFYSIKELKALNKDESKPVITRIIANQFELALTKGNWNKIKEILEHVIGKPLQKTESEIKTELDLSVELAKEIKKAFEDEL